MAGLRPNTEIQYTETEYSSMQEKLLVFPSNMYRPPGAADREFWLYFVGFLASKVVRMAPDDPQDSFGPSFRPNGRFWTRFGPFSMIWARTDIVDPTWTSRTRPGTAPWNGLDPSQRLWNGPGMLLDQVSGQTVDSRSISDQI